jgi:hypothetical protein
MPLLREVRIPATERPGEIGGLLYEIERDEWLRLRAPHLGSDTSGQELTSPDQKG